MPFKLTWEPRRLYLKFDGFVPDAEFMRAAEAIQNDARLDEVRSRVFDFLDITGFDLSDSTFELLVAMTLGVASYRPQGSMALVVTEPFLLQVARKYCAEQAGMFPAAVFATVREAWDWAEMARLANANRLGSG